MSRLVGDQSSKSSAAKACPVPSPPPMLLPSSPSRKTIEDVWKDISQSFLRDHHGPISVVSGTILQDFMSGPFQRSPAAPDLSGRARLDSPATYLSLNTGCHVVTRQSDPDKVMSSGLNDHRGKRGPGTRDESYDRRHKRLIKNRESAARSRARRQAYTTELEIELERLQQENAMLRKQQEMLFLSIGSASDDKVPKKKGLQRTLTGPF